MERKIYTLLETWGGVETAQNWSVWVTVVAIAVVAYLAYEFCMRILTPIIERIVDKTETKWDDDLVDESVLKAVSQLVPAIIVATLLPGSLNMGETVYLWAVKLTKLYILWAAIRLIVIFLIRLQNAIDGRKILQQHNLGIIRQTVVLFVVIMGVIVGIGILVNRDPLAILTGLGASAAILMLVFRDTILNFVAGIQLTVNKMLTKGDWIVSTKAGANGEVEEVKLTTVKVRNWDNSIVTIPPYTLFTDSFQNFQAMRDVGARRVARSVFIDQTTIRFLTPDEIHALREEGMLADAEEALPEKIVNLGLLRRYMEHYLENHSDVIGHDKENPALILMVRQLQPTPQGVPLELYFFTSLTGWKPYEHIQSDIFDHFYAVIPKFHLAVYQSPSSDDFKRMQPLYV